MLADISLFESYGNQGRRDAFINNSDASVILQKYDQTKKGVALCKKYIEMMQNEDFIPADLISDMYASKEKYDTDLLNQKQSLMEQVSKEPLDTFDRQVFMHLSDETQKDLQDVITADEVFQRALEMKQEAVEKEEQKKLASDDDEFNLESEGTGELEDDIKALEEELKEGGDEESSEEEKSDNYGLDVSSEE